MVHLSLNWYEKAEKELFSSFELYWILDKVAIPR